jgi:hypothetical protein
VKDSTFDASANYQWALNVIGAFDWMRLYGVFHSPLSVCSSSNTEEAKTFSEKLSLFHPDV